MTEQLLEKKAAQGSETEVDRRLETYARKMLHGKLTADEQAAYEQLVNARTGRLVKLPLGRESAAFRWLRNKKA